MTPEEKEIMADMFYFLRDHCEMPNEGTDACTSFWARAADDISALVGVKWNNHPLAMEVGMALYNYLRTRIKAVKRNELEKP